MRFKSVPPQTWHEATKTDPPVPAACGGGGGIGTTFMRCFLVVNGINPMLQRGMQQPSLTHRACIQSDCSAYHCTARCNPSSNDTFGSNPRLLSLLISGQRRGVLPCCSCPGTNLISLLKQRA